MALPPQRRPQQQPGNKRTGAPTPTNKRVPPQGSSQQPPAARRPNPATTTQRPATNALEGNVSVKRQADELAMKDKEIRLLRAKIVKYEKIMNDVKNLAANISYTATKTNSVGPGVMSDWAKKIFDTINGR